jgi:hypothetical protein
VVRHGSAKAVFVGSIPTLASLLNYRFTKGGGQRGDKFSSFDGVDGVSVDDEYHTSKRREQALYVLAFDEFEQKNVTPQQRRILGSAAVPDIEDTRSRDSRRVSLGVLTDAAERVSASYTPNMAEALEGAFDNPSPELLAKMLGVSVDLVNGAVLDEWNPRPECLASVCKIFEWHNKAAARSAETIKMWAIIRIAGVSLDCANTRLAAAGLAFEGYLSLQCGLGRIQDCAASIEVSRAAIYMNVKFWQRELDLPARFSLEQVISCKLGSPQVDGFDRPDILLQKLTGSIYSQKSSKDRARLAWHNRAKTLKAEKSKGRSMERIVGGFLDCVNSKNAKFWQRELDLPAVSNMRGAEKCRAYSKAQKAKHWRNQKFTLVGV